MPAAIETGVPKLRIEEVATATQARIDSGIQTIVGVNRYQPQSSSEVEQIEVRRIDNSEVRAQQIAQLDVVRNSRNEKMVTGALVALRRAAAGNDNLMPFAIEAARQRATVGEMSNAMACLLYASPSPRD